jgi:predicted transposase YdaD
VCIENGTYKYNSYRFNDQNEAELENSSNPFAIAVLAGKYANAAKNDDEKRYRFKYKLMRLVLQKMIQPLDERRIYLSALTYFIDYLLQLPIELTEKLRNEIMISKEAIDLIYLDRKNLPPTFGEFRKLEREEGKLEGLLIERKRIVSKLTRENFTVEQIADLTELSIEEVKMLQ